MSLNYMLLFIIPILYAVSGIFLLVIVALKPKLFWPILISVTVGTAGLIMAPRSSHPQCFLDEYLLGCILLGCLLAISIGAVRFKKKQGNIWDYLHRWTFSLFIAYMIIQSIRGFLLWKEWELSRWVIYYLMLGILAFIISRADLVFPSTKKASLIILWSTLVYFTAYLAHGLITKYIRGIPTWRLDIQGFEWSGSGYAVFPLVVAIPAAIFILKYGIRRQKLIGWALIIIVLILGYFYDCRSAYISVLAFTIISPTVLRFRRVILWLLIVGVLVSFFWSFSLDFFIATTKYAFLQGSQDTVRWIQFEAAFSAMSANLKTLFFGYGINSHHYVIIPYLIEAGYPYPVPSSYMRVSGLAGLIIDTGLIGIILLPMNFLFVARMILVQKKSPGRVILLLALFLPLFWFIISKIEDIVLLFLMIMPSGLLVQLCRYKEGGSIIEGKSPNSRPISNNFVNKKLL